MKKALCISLITTISLNSSIMEGSTSYNEQPIAMTKEVSPINNETEDILDDGLKSMLEEYARLEEQNSLELENKISSINDKFEEEFAKVVAEEEQKRQERIEQERIRQEQERLKREQERNSICFNPYNLLEVSNMSVDRISYVLPEGLKHLASAFYDVEQNYGVNSIFLISLVREESGNGTSDYAIYRNNVGGVRNSDGSYRHFNSQYESVDYIGRLIKKHYLTPHQFINGEEVGLYYNGTSIWNVNIKYCEGTEWAEKLNKIAYETLEKAREY